MRENRRYIFISNVDIKKPRGGWDGLGGKIFELLTGKLHIIDLLDKINPPVKFLPRLQSKVFRKLGLAANFPVFSARRLKLIAGILEEKLNGKNDYLIFHGATPWIYFQPKQEYCAILDCSFITYMNVYHDISKYSKRDIDRIGQLEKQFLQKASYVFFTSDWALQDTCRNYGLTDNNMVRIGQGSSTSIRPVNIQVAAIRKQFLMIATDFLGKGGAVICRCFEKLIIQYPGYILVIVGQQPPEHLMKKPYVRYLGYINKSTAEGEQQLEELYQQSKALLMMTRRDIAPLVIIEAALQGCPSIVNNLCAIGEMIVNEETGFLIENGEAEMLQRMVDVAGMDAEKELQIRGKAYDFISRNFNWEKVIAPMLDRI